MASPISGLGQVVAALPSVGGGSGGTGGFESVLSDAMSRVEQYRVNSDNSIQRLLTGEDEELHKVALATQQAEMSFELFVQAKNKVVQAYQEVMRMQL